ncbi:unnamed protein product [Vicia faba]|uniref:PWWP domain-containing protein n=1 Tax=Vicia faba TaxID=3906 RepID=A0AAV1AZ09_VICFA|nr:unnamed protein product [Vicia faba]
MNNSSDARVSPNQDEPVRVSSDDTDKFPLSDSKSLLLEFDEYVASERNIDTGTGTDLGYGFEVGDLVWGKVKSHPWWPGHIYNEAFASPSVRRARREGHVLVAFFGDSSYGWFEPEELIPFEANFAEKSQQTYSRTFIKAVEEAVDEASRRRGLGLACKCRNGQNFRPVKVKGYYSVDVLDYEPGGVYSESQIRNARDSFDPLETLDFVRELALAPLEEEHGSIGFVQNKATVNAYRKAVFEQYDETYAQAFGVQRARPSRPQNAPINQPARQPTKAPLTGPLVIAETLGGGKSTAKSVKFKDNPKKDRYLFKRRDDQSNSSQLTYKEEIPDTAGHYVFQNRSPPVPVIPPSLENRADSGFVSHDGATSTSDAKEASRSQVKAENSGLAPQLISLDTKPHVEKGKMAYSEETTHSFEQDDTSSKNIVGSDLSGELTLQSTVDETSQSSHPESNIHVNVEHDRAVKLLEPCENLKQPEQGIPTVVDGGKDTHQVKRENNSSVEAKHRETIAAKKIKGHKRPADDMNSKTAVIEERKKKKKNSLNVQTTSDHLEKHSTSVKSVHHSGNLTGKSVFTTLPPREGIQPEQMQVEFSARNLLPVDTLGDVNLEVPQLLGDLQALALNPFHGIERRIPVAVRQFFLRFRSLVYQKSLPSSPPTENEAPEVRAAKSSSDVKTSDNSEDHVRASPIVKPVKNVRPDDPTKGGRKRLPSDRQEEIAAKRLKKIKDIKALAADKTAANQKTSEARREDKATSSQKILEARREDKTSSTQKTSEARREDGKEPVSQAPSKFVKPDSAKKIKSPTTLVIKFPPETSLPSVPELKARFARFGPMDQSGFRIFWKSLTCRVVFLYKADAQAAFKFSAANPSLFGSTGVKCSLRDDSASEASEATQVRGDDRANEILRVRDPAAAQQLTSQKPLVPQSTVQLKSCLKKSTGDESGQGTGNGSSSSKGNPRVKFLLVGEESSSRGELVMVGNKNNNLSDAGAPVATDFISKNIQKVTTTTTTTSSQPPLLPTPPQFIKSPQQNLRNSELAMASRNNPNFINTPTTSATVDISQQMISLLTRCSDVVTNLTGVLGYVPYHPL